MSEIQATATVNQITAVVSNNQIQVEMAGPISPVWGTIGGDIEDQADLQAELDGKADAAHIHTSDDISDFQVAVSANTDVVANSAARHSHANKSILDLLTVVEGSLLYNGGQIGVTNHSELSGLDQDDHPQYLTESRGDVRYLQSFTELDPVFSMSPAYGIDSNDISNWDEAHGWGNHALAGYLTSFSETDPAFSASPAAGIATQDITNWNAAFGWGNHASAGYATSASLSAYALLAGRSGGQTLIGGTVANNALVLQANSAVSGNTLTTAGVQIKVGNSGATTALTVLNNGNVGIGTTSPGSILTLLDDSGAKITLTHTQQNMLVDDIFGSISFSSNDDTVDAKGEAAQIKAIADGAWQGTTSPTTYSSALAFFTTSNARPLAPIERMRIDGRGNVGIGTTSPSTKLHIGAGAMTLEAMTAPSSPASDKAVLFLEATGTSPSRIVALKVKWENGTTSTLASVTV